MNEDEARNLEGRIHDDEKYLYEMRETSIKGLWVAENEEGINGYVRNPSHYEKIGMDEEFRVTYKKVKP